MSRTPRQVNEYDDYWSEFHDIEENKEVDVDEEESSSKTPDEGEEEALWLRDAGYDFVVNRLAEGKELTDEEIQGFTATLTTNQAAVVKRRVNTLTATYRKKQKHKTDVRDIFPEKNSTQLPKSPSPTQVLSDSSDDGILSSDHSRKSNHKRKSSSGFLKRGGEYSMSGRRNEVMASSGIEMLRVQPRGTFNRQLSNKVSDDVNVMPSISDEDIEFTLKLEETSQNKNFKLVADKLGVTHVEDLSTTDIDHIRSLSLIELTSLFDSHNIIYYRRKGKKKTKDHGIFGVPLQTLIENDQRHREDVQVPLVFSDIIGFLTKHCLDTEGILRVPGSVSRIKQLRQELEEKFYMGTFSWVDVMPNDAAALMKLFLRELPVPLLTHEYIEAFAQVENIKDKKFQLQALNLLVLLLPDEHRATLKILLEFLEAVVTHRILNRMGLANVAMIMAPNLFLAPSSRSKTKSIKDLEISMAAGTSNIVMMLIKYQKILWTVPSFLLQQMRQENDLETHRRNRDKSIMKFLGKKDKSELYKKPNITHESDFEEGVIRVQAPNLTKSCAAIKLTDTMTAGDIVNKFRNNDASHSTLNGRTHKKKKEDNVTVESGSGIFAEKNAHLFEVGGNIGERCLDHCTHMLALYYVNPNAEWVIKSVGAR
ncbi:hypothetical protein FSP39_021540 [Pinctada imbricata]|uniref:Rho-GAP domain-containing protein n=1 Tax=Pinctada imbricata TaxID=66713 RepID=A0AA89BP43_PINIB|nr:hypothetical protein FSP39_021540 [Pinctada imbricata]